VRAGLRLAVSRAMDQAMPTFTCEETEIHYEVHGDGYPVVLFAPGGMRSSIPYWDRSPFHPVRELRGQFRVVAIDQRNAGQSRAPVSAKDGWHTYAADHLALLDHLGIDRCHLLGACIGGSFSLRLIATAPERVTAAVLLQPIGLGGDNRHVFHALLDGWAEELVRDRPDLTPEAFAGLRSNLYGGDFVFSVSRDDVRRCPAPLLVLRGNDVYHPAETSEEIARIAPRAELVASWKDGPDVRLAVARVLAFLAEHTPA
jgi:pimeloyl-ACP methyl ester carboxylesterase